MRTLITGGTGFLGTHVTRELELRNYDVIPVNGSDADLVDRADTISLFNEIKPTYVVHLAASVGGIQANLENSANYWYDNLMMGINVLDTCQMFNVEKLLMVGTVCSYPKFACTPFVEEQLWEGYPEESNAAYGIAKKSLLVGAQAYREQYGLNTIFLMPANLYGPGDNFTGQGGHVVADMIHKFHHDNGELWGDGWATRDLLYVEDAAEGLAEALYLYNGSWPVNLGTGREINIRELADLLKPLCDFRGEVTFDEKKPNGQPRRVLDTSKAKGLFSWEATTSLEKGLKQTVKWYRKNILTPSDKPDKVVAP
jgi:GDP-L-fucose synthase